MKENMYRFYNRIIMILVAVGVIMTMYFEEILLSIVVVLIGIIIKMALRTRLSQPDFDERTYVISEKASRLTVQITGLLFALLGLLLIFLERINYSEFHQAGYLFAFCALIIIILNTLFFSYYRRKLGG